MVPPLVQQGLQLGNHKFMNGSFLVLNLGTNTVGVGNACTSSKALESFNPIAIDRAYKLDDNGNAPTSFNSNEEGSSIPQSSKRKGVSEEKEDPDWVPEKKAKKNSSSTSRAIKLKQNLVSDNGTFSSCSRDGNVMRASKSGPPPQYLVSLLNFFGWKVVFRQESNDYAYISPVGLTYFSLPKAFETFLQGTSKYNKGRAVGTSFVRSSSTHCDLARGISIFNCKSRLLMGRVATDSADRSGGIKNNSSVTQNNSITETNEKSPKPYEGPANTHGKESLRMPEVAVSQEAKQLSSLEKINERANSGSQDRCLSAEFMKRGCGDSLGAESGEGGRHDMHQDNGRLLERRSARISGSHVPIYKDSYLPIFVIPKGAVRSKGKLMATTSEAQSIVSKTSKGLLNERSIGMPECSSVSAMIKNHKEGSSMHQASTVSTFRTSGHYSELDAEIIAQSSLLNLSNSVASSVSSSIEKRLVTDVMLLEKMNFSKGFSNGETKSLYHESNAHMKKTDANIGGLKSSVHVTGIRKSMGTSGKHIGIYDGLDTDQGSNKDFSDCLGSVAQRLVIKDKENTTASLSDRCFSSAKDIAPQTPLADKCSPSSTTKRKPIIGNGKKNKQRRRGCGLVVRREDKDHHNQDNLSYKKANILSWLIDSGTVTEHEKVVYIRKSMQGNIPIGLVTRGGIWCSCCKEVVSMLDFELHAGSNFRQPWDHIFLMSGKSLMQCLKEAWEKEKQQNKIGYRALGIDESDPSDDTCGICADGGHLICCDTCPSTFHQDCLMLKALPKGSWCCPYCRCAFCMVGEHGSYIASDTLVLISCKQCGRKYHQECAWANDIKEMDSLPSCFCGKKCQKIAAHLSAMLGIANHLEGGFSWTLLRRLDEDEGFNSDQRASLHLECNAKLRLALSVLHECFVPLMDQGAGVDMISQAVYNCGSNFNRLNYEGFYTVVLEKNEEIITAASLRFHGMRLAEMPFIGTLPTYRRQGMCTLLLKIIEDMLSSLKVEKLIIPAISDLKETWIKSFSFKPLEKAHKDEIRNLSMMIFAETTLLQKSICDSGEMNQRDSSRINDGSINGESFRGRDELQTPFESHMYTGVAEVCIDAEACNLSPDLFAILHPEITNMPIL